MSEKNDGGPAFPWLDLSEGTTEDIGKGMTLRDYFAAKAMEEMLRFSHERCALAREVTGGKNSPNIPLLARGAYSVADAMLKAREQ